MVDLNHVRMSERLGRAAVYCPAPGAAAPMVSRSQLVKLAEQMAWSKAGAVMTFCATHSKRLTNIVHQRSRLLRTASPATDPERLAAARRERRGAALLLSILQCMRRIAEAVNQHRRDLQDADAFLAKNAALLKDDDCFVVNPEIFDPLAAGCEAHAY